MLAVAGNRYVVRGELGKLTVPPTISALVGSRLDRLSDLERRVLTAGAILGESFAACAAATIAGVEPASARALLDGLVSIALLGFERDPRSPLHGRYLFLQGVVRRVALSRLSRRERKRCHLAAVEYLSHDAAAEPELAAALAGHLLMAVEADPKAADVASIRERAGGMLSAAAERAAAVGALTEALALLDRAAELTADELARATILERSGTVAFRAGEPDAAQRRYKAAQELHKAAGRERDLLRAHAQELRARSYVRSPTEVLPALRALDAALGERHDALKAFAVSQLAFTLYQCGKHAEALSAATRAVEIAEECADRTELVHALGARGSALSQLERPREAIAVLRRAASLAAEHDPRQVAMLSGNLAVALESVGRYGEAVDRAHEAIAAAERSGERFFERWNRLVLGRALCSLGDWDKATQEIEPVKDHVPPFSVGMAIAPLVVIALGRGQYKRARELVAEHDRRCADAASSAFESDFRVLRSAALAGGRTGSAAELARLISSAGTADYAEWTGWLAPIVDRLVEEPAVEPLATALAALRAPGVMKRTAPVVAQALRIEAHLAARSGEHARADECWARAQQLTSECGLAFETAVIELERAEYAAAFAGGAGLDQAGLSAAGATFERLGAAPWLARARHLLRH